MDHLYTHKHVTEEELKDSNVEVIWGNMKQVELKQDHLTLKPFQTVLLKEKKED